VQDEPFDPKVVFPIVVLVEPSDPNVVFPIEVYEVPSDPNVVSPIVSYEVPGFIGKVCAVSACPRLRNNEAKIVHSNI
jgi:hypothetical protein